MLNSYLLNSSKVVAFLCWLSLIVAQGKDVLDTEEEGQLSGVLILLGMSICTIYLLGVLLAARTNLAGRIILVPALITLLAAILPAIYESFVVSIFGGSVLLVICCLLVIAHLILIGNRSGIN